MAETDETVFDTRTINAQIKKLILMGKAVKIEGLSGQNCIAVGLMRGKTKISGIAGDYFGAFNAGGRLSLDGSAGRFLGDSMSGGEIVVNGDVGIAAGVYMTGGNLVVRGNVAERAGLNLRGGIFVIDGNAGPFVGEYMQGGAIIVTGNTGPSAGQWMIGGEIYIAGSIESIGRNARILEPDKEEIDAIKKVLKVYDITGVMGFSKILPVTPRPFFEEEAISLTKALDYEVMEKEAVLQPEIVEEKPVVPEIVGPADEVQVLAESGEELNDLDARIAEMRKKRKALLRELGMKRGVGK